VCYKHPTPLFHWSYFDAFGTTCKLYQNLCFTQKRGLAIRKGLNILRGRASFPATTSYVQLSKNTYRQIIPFEYMFCYAKRRFTPYLLIGLCPAHSLRKGYSRLNLIEKMLRVSLSIFSI